jgi:hypothetical protein
MGAWKYQMYFECSTWYFTSEPIWELNLVLPSTHVLYFSVYYIKLGQYLKSNNFTDWKEIIENYDHRRVHLLSQTVTDGPGRSRSSGVARPSFLGGEANAEGARPSMGVRGHAPPGKFWNLESLKCDFKHFGGEILQNSEDYKVHRRRNFSQTFLIFYSELNKLEKSPWKTGGADQRHLHFPSVMPQEENPNVIVVRNVAFKSF